MPDNAKDDREQVIVCLVFDFFSRYKKGKTDAGDAGRRHARAGM